MFEKNSTQVREIFELNDSNIFRHEMFKKFRPEMFFKKSTQGVRGIFNPKHSRNFRLGIFEKNSTRIIRKIFESKYSKNL